MEPAIVVAVGALILSLVNSLVTAKTYKKNKRLEFLQRRDYLAQKIADLNERNTQAHLISARLAIVVVRNAGLALEGEQAGQNIALIGSLNDLQGVVEQGMCSWDEAIERLHSIYSTLTLEIQATEVERAIDICQVASDYLKNTNDKYTAVLHVVEATSDILKLNLTELHEKIRQLNLLTAEMARQEHLRFVKDIEQLADNDD